jgi:hypothetical protein
MVNFDKTIRNIIGDKKSKNMAGKKYQVIGEFHYGYPESYGVELIKCKDGSYGWNMPGADIEETQCGYKTEDEAFKYAKERTLQLNQSQRKKKYDDKRYSRMN